MEYTEFLQLAQWCKIQAFYTYNIESHAVITPVISKNVLIHCRDVGLVKQEKTKGMGKACAEIINRKEGAGN